MSELKKCPFCGGGVQKTARFCLGYIGDGVRCPKCGAETPATLTDDKAEQWWNRRTDDWISVSERLPENETVVQVTHEDSENSWIAGYREDEFVDVCNDDVIYFVTFWKPLPSLSPEKEY